MTVTVRLFAVLRERVGSDSIEVELDDGATVAEALERLAERPELGDLLERMPVRMAVNRDYADGDTALASGDELALVPPVSGGSPDSEVHVAGYRRAAFARDALAPRLPSGGRGDRLLPGDDAGVPELEYEAYREMAEERIAVILARVR